jgi:hypothetical protein
MTVQDARDITFATRIPERMAVDMIIKLVQRQIALSGNAKLTDAIFKIPTFLPDAPPYNMDRVADDLVEHFVEQGFYCRRVPGIANLLFISWAEAKPSFATGARPKLQTARRKTTTGVGFRVANAR